MHQYIDCTRGGNTVLSFAIDCYRLQWNRVKLLNNCSILTTCVGQHSKRSFWEREGNSQNPSEKHLAIKQSNKGPAQEILLLGIKWLAKAGHNQDFFSFGVVCLFSELCYVIPYFLFSLSHPLGSNDMALNGYITSLITNQPLGKSNNTTTLRAMGAGTFKHSNIGICIWKKPPAQSTLGNLPIDLTLPSQNFYLT